MSHHGVPALFNKRISLLDERWANCSCKFKAIIWFDSSSMLLIVTVMVNYFLCWCYWWLVLQMLGNAIMVAAGGNKWDVFSKCIVRRVMGLHYQVYLTKCWYVLLQFLQGIVWFPLLSFCLQNDLHGCLGYI